MYSYLKDTTLGRMHDAEDATQNVLVSVLRALPSYEERGQFKAWVFRIAHHEGLRAIRSRRLVLWGDVGNGNDWNTNVSELGTEDPAPRQDEAMSSRECTAQLEAVIDRLPPKEREVFYLRARSGFSFKEIAAISGAPINTALSRMRSAVKKLRRSLEPTDL